LNQSTHSAVAIFVPAAVHPPDRPGDGHEPAGQDLLLRLRLVQTQNKTGCSFGTGNNIFDRLSLTEDPASAVAAAHYNKALTTPNLTLPLPQKGKTKSIPATLNRWYLSGDYPRSTVQRARKSDPNYGRYDLDADGVTKIPWECDEYPFASNDVVGGLRQPSRERRDSNNQFRGSIWAGAVTVV
jgi:hypothetical protein